MIKVNDIIKLLGDVTVNIVGDININGKWFNGIVLHTIELGTDTLPTELESASVKGIDFTRDGNGVVLNSMDIVIECSLDTK